MIISKTQMDNMHAIQLEIFKNVIFVCEKLGLRYFLVHGSLLGAVRMGGFIPLDDDIDIAMPRVDYERFINEGPGTIDKRYFIQHHNTDKKYPLEFIKVRDSETTYIAGPCRNIDMHHGVFIDIFPIDYVETTDMRRKMVSIVKKVLGVRIGCVLSIPCLTVKRSLLRGISRILVPSWNQAVNLNERLNKRLTSGKYVRITGGKPMEACVPVAWFTDRVDFEFEGIRCSVPARWHEYLSLIYGDYSTRTLLEDKEHDENCVEINAILLDLEKSYKEYR